MYTPGRSFSVDLVCPQRAFHRAGLPWMTPGLAVGMTDTTATPDQRWMQCALDLAAQGRFTPRPNPMVGCVLVKDGQVVGEGWHQRAGEPHAEVHALRMAGALAAGSTAYVTLEPCSHQGRTPPCANALIAAGISRVVAAMVDPDPRVAGSGLARLREAGIEAESGVLEAGSRELNCGFLSRIERGRPWVRMKIAMSLDGKVALADGSSKWITGRAARADGHQWRARAGVILTGVGTVIADDPQLTVRVDEECAPTVPVIVDSRGRCPAEAKVFALHEQVWLAGRSMADAGGTKCPASARILELPAAQDGRANLPALMVALAQEQINEIHVEAGPELNASLLRAELVDELLFYQAGKFLGEQALSALPLLSPRSIPEGEWMLVQAEALAGDCFTRWQRIAGS